MGNSASIAEALRATLGPGNVSDDRALLQSFASDISFTPSGRPGLVVYPRSKEDVQAIVRAAHEARVALCPVSSGAPHFRGDTVPAGDAVIVDFSRMNNILRIDPVSRSVMIEPGVTYGELAPALRKEGLKLSMPFLPRANKSVVASRLEREPTTIPKWQYDYLDPLLTLEVVYGNGDEFRTGSAAGPGTLETLKADLVNPWGPGTVDYYRFVSGAQGSMGLVTWTVLKAEVRPVKEKVFYLASDDVAAIVDCANALTYKKVGDEMLALDAASLAAILANDKPESIDRLRQRLPAWTLIVCLAGYPRRPDQRLAFQERYLREIAAEHGLSPSLDLPGAEGAEENMLSLLSATSPAERFWKLQPKRAAHDLFFLSPMSKVASLASLMADCAAEAGVPREYVRGYIQPMAQGRGCHVEFSIACDPGDDRETARAKALLDGAAPRLMKAGAFFSRPYGAWAEMVYEDYPEGVAALRELKAIFDPHHILNPGKLCF